MISSLHRLEIAIHELAEAKHQAEQFGWPEETVSRIDLLMRGAAKLRAQMQERVLQRAKQHDEQDACGETATAIQ